MEIPSLLCAFVGQAVLFLFWPVSFLIFHIFWTNNFGTRIKQTDPVFPESKQIKELCPRATALYISSCIYFIIFHQFFPAEILQVQSGVPERATSPHQTKSFSPRSAASVARDAARSAFYNSWLYHILTTRITRYRISIPHCQSMFFHNKKIAAREEAHRRFPEPEGYQTLQYTEAEAPDKAFSGGTFRCTAL